MPISILTGPGTINWTKNPIIFNFSFSLMQLTWKLEIRLRDATSGAVISTVKVPFDTTSGVMGHNVAAMCDPYPTLVKPSNLLVATQDLSQDISQQVKRVYIDFRPVGNGAPTAYTASTPFYIIKGGIADMSLDDLYINLGTFNQTNFMPGGSKFLTWLPNNRSMTRKEWGWMAYLSTTDAGTQYARYTVWRMNNTQVTIDKALTGSTVSGNTWKLWLIPVGVEQAKLDPTNIGVWYVDISVKTITTNLTNIHRIYCDNRPYYRTLTIHYRNSMGGFDQVLCRGDIEEGYDATKQTAQIKDLQPAFYAKTRPMWKVQTGFLMEKQVRAIGFELVNTTEAYIVHNGKLLPVRIPSQQPGYNRRDSLWSLSFDIEVAAEFEIFPRQLAEF